MYSGCGRNENNFKTEKQCKSACGHWGKDYIINALASSEGITKTHGVPVFVLPVEEA